MRNYEAVFIFEPVMEEEVRENLLGRIKEAIEIDGEITKVDEWGLRKLAYPINDLNEGYYVLINFKGLPETVAEVERRTKIFDSIMRHMIVREDE